MIMIAGQSWKADWCPAVHSVVPSPKPPPREYDRWCATSAGNRLCIKFNKFQEPPRTVADQIDQQYLPWVSERTIVEGNQQLTIKDVAAGHSPCDIYSPPVGRSSPYKVMVRGNTVVGSKPISLQTPLGLMSHQDLLVALRGAGIQI